MSRLRSTARQLASLVLALTLSCARAMAEGDVCQLQLEVFINQAPTHLIGSFTRLPDGKIAVSRTEMEEVGLKPRGYASPDEMIVPDDLAGLSYRYDEAKQQLFVTVTDELRVAKTIDVSTAPKNQVAVRTDYGAVLNYTLYSGGTSQWAPYALAFNGSSATLDARAFTPFGTLSQSGILRSAFDNRFNALRLDTTFAYSDRETLTTYRAGDTISGGLAWTRPIRIGGLQAQRNFGLRPDLVTLPLPSLSGSAAVPSTVDVFVNNVRTSSQDIESGPYRVSNVPAVTGAGTARVVLRDASGRETITNLPFSYLPRCSLRGCTTSPSRQACRACSMQLLPMPTPSSSWRPPAGAGACSIGSPSKAMPRPARAYGMRGPVPRFAPDRSVLPRPRSPPVGSPGDRGSRAILPTRLPCSE